MAATARRGIAVRPGPPAVPPPARPGASTPGMALRPASRPDWATVAGTAGWAPSAAQHEGRRRRRRPSPRRPPGPSVVGRHAVPSSVRSPLGMDDDHPPAGTREPARRFVPPSTTRRRPPGDIPQRPGPLGRLLGAVHDRRPRRPKGILQAAPARAIPPGSREGTTMAPPPLRQGPSRMSPPYRGGGILPGGARRRSVHVDMVCPGGPGRHGRHPLRPPPASAGGVIRWRNDESGVDRSAAPSR